MEQYTACPDGTLVSGLYIKWHGDYYSGYSIGTDMWIEHRVKGGLPGAWVQGLEFEIVAYSENGTVAVRGGYSPAMIELLDSGVVHQLEVLESGRAGVVGDLHWSEMSNISTKMTDLPLPVS